MNRKEKSNEYFRNSVHTQLSYWMALIAIGIQFILGIVHMDEAFGQLCMIEFLFGLSGILILDYMHGKKKIYPERFKRISPNLLFRFAITFGVIAGIQFLFQIIPLITSTEMALAIVFCPVCEEYFFRGLLMEPTFKMGLKAKEKFRIWKDKEISYIELGGILFSAILFATFHVNYYGDVKLMGMVFVGGLWLGFVYWWNKDLTAIILAHFLLNIIFVYQFWMVYL